MNRLDMSKKTVAREKKLGKREKKKPLNNNQARGQMGDPLTSRDGLFSA